MFSNATNSVQIFVDITPAQAFAYKIQERCIKETSNKKSLLFKKEMLTKIFQKGKKNVLFKVMPLSQNVDIY